MLKRVKIQGYKSLADVEVKLEPLSVFFGPNAAGKSNFLDALQLLSRIATTPRLRDAFDAPHRGNPLESFTFGPEGIPGLLKQEKTSFSLEVDVEISQKLLDSVNEELQRILTSLIDAPGLQGKGVDEEAMRAQLEQQYKHLFHDLSLNTRALRYSITVESFLNKGILRIADEKISAIGDKVKSIERGVFTLKPEESMISDRNIRSRISPSVPAVAAMHEELASWLFFDLEPRERMRMSSPFREVDHIGPAGEDLPTFLYTLHAQNKPQFQGIEHALHYMMPSITGIDLTINNYGNVDLNLMQGKKAIPVSLLSNGTLRLLSLLTLSSIQDAPALIGIEEPEHGIRLDQLDLIVRLLETLTYGGSQIITTTHSPTLIDFLPKKSIFIFESKNGQTTINPLLTWKNRKWDDSDEDQPLLSELVLRGDFYA